MTTQTEALKLALEALESLVESHGYTSYISDEEKEAEGEVMFARSTITAIKEALAQTERDLKPKCFADFQPNHEHDRKCQWCAVEIECKTGVAQPEQEPVTIDWNAVHDKMIEVWNREISADEGFDEIQDLIDTIVLQRKPLIGETLLSAAQSCLSPEQYDHFEALLEDDLDAHNRLARAIEAKLKEKNT